MTIRRLSPWHLERMNIDSFGKLADTSVGPFAAGMNVIFGKNESGKTTLNSFTTGVLFGWPDGRSQKNTYKPANAGRGGRLLFRNIDGSEALLGRTRNADGVQDEHNLLGDIDAGTYQTVFALDSDELLSLDDSAAVTSQLLTAGSGTVASPVNALQEIDARIASYTSRAAAAQHSITNISAQLKDVEERLARAEEEAASLIAESREAEELEAARVAASREHDELNALIEGRSADLSLLHNLENQLSDLREQRAAIEAALADETAAEQQAAARDAGASADMAALRDLSAPQERIIRDTLDDFQAERDRLMSAVDYAKRDLANSKAAYQVLEEELGKDKTHDVRKRTAGQIVLSIILPLVALVAGVPTAIYGANIGSLTITAFGVFLALAAIVMGAAALVVAMKPESTGMPLEQRVEDARWVMLQDQKKLETSEAELTEIGEQIASYFHFNHLSDAGRSLRRARGMLDDARDLRQAALDIVQQRQNLNVQLADVDEGIARLQAQCDELFADAGVGDIASFEELLDKAIDRRRQLLDEMERMNTRAGELGQILSQARGETTFAELKQEHAGLMCRLNESRREYACLLMARHNLADAIEQWESKSQPEVYRLASRLFEDMTDGAWTQIRLTADGQVQVADSRGDVREPMLLSLGARQQLYLSLRLALLMTADNVGRALPVLADDILVNFDSDRRRSAARALLELSAMRQVLFFTCHEEVLALLLELAPDVNVMRLSAQPQE